MPIAKRKVPKRKPKPRVKLSPHDLLCRSLYNRLQQDSDDDVRYVMDALTPVSMSAHLALQWLTSQCSTEISTLQLNGPYGEGATFRVFMRYEDRTKKPKYGHLYPTLYCVKSSPVLTISVMLCYIELSKHLGRFPHAKT